MKRDFMDYLFPVVLVLALVIMFGALGYSIWFTHTHYCAKQHQEWVAKSCTQMSYDVSNPMYFVENCTEAHSNTVCDAWERNK